MNSINKSAIKTFEIAAKFIAFYWRDEVPFKENREITFCTKVVEQSSSFEMQIIINNYINRNNFSDSLKKSLAQFDQWITTNASQEQIDYWRDKRNKYPLNFFTFEQMNEHENMAAEAFLRKKHLDLYKAIYLDV